MSSRQSEDFSLPTVMLVTTNLNRGGAQNKLLAVANAVNPERYRVVVCALRGGLLAPHFRVPVHADLLSSKWDARVLRRLMQLIAHYRPAIVWVIGTGDAGFWGRLAARAMRVPVVIQSFHATGRVGGKPTIDRFNRLLDRIPGMTDYYVMVGKAHKDYITSVEGIPPERSRVIYNGVDTNEFQPGLDGASRREEFGVPPETPLVGIVALFKPEKRHDVFLQAAAKVLEVVPDAHFLAVGDGPRRPASEQLARQLGISHRVHFTGDREDVPEIMCALDASVLSSDPVVETFSNTVLESMASGLPVVATDVGSLREAIVDGETGYLIPPRNPQALTAAIVRLLQNPDLRRRMGEAGRRRVIEHFSLEQMVHAREQLFEELLTCKEKPVSST